MRWLVVAPVLAMAAMAASGCSKSAEGGNSAAGSFKPPNTTSRADYGGKIERRFRKLDKNGDGKLEASELPEKMQRRVARMDGNSDGSVSSEEFGAYMLKRFDKRDKNGDGSVNSNEGRGDRKGRRNRDTTEELDAEVNMIE